jgi:hypothetical protein
MKLRFGSVLVATALLAGACGGGGGTGSTDLTKLLSDSTTKTRETSVRLALDVSVTGSSLPQGEAHITGAGEFDYSSQRGVINEEIPDITGSGGGTKEIEIRVIGRTVYARVPGVGTPDKPWIETDASTFGAQSGSFGSSDPTQFIDFLKGVSSGIKDEGDDTVRGDHTTELAFRIDLRKAEAKLGSDQRQAVEQAIQQLGTSTLPAHAWIDDQGRLRRMSFSFDIHQNGKSANIDITLELFDFGVKVDVQPPPASQVSQSGLGGQ